MGHFWLREYRAADAYDVAHIWRESWLSTGLAVPSAPPEEEFRERIMSEITHGWHVCVACFGHRIIGFLATKPKQRVLDQLFISPSTQGKGIGSALMLAKQQMPNGFWLSTDAKNERARSFYEKHGLQLQRYEAHPTRGHPTAIYAWNEKGS